MTEKRAVTVIIENDNDEVLLMQRSESEESESLKWENCGGKIEIDENPESALRREVKEELGVELSDFELLMNIEPIFNGVQWEVNIYKGKVEGSPKIMEQDKCNGIRWFKKENLDNIDLAGYARRDFILLGWIKADI